jgi:hypothetical protein
MYTALFTLIKHRIGLFFAGYCIIIGIALILLTTTNQYIKHMQHCQAIVALPLQHKMC